MKRRLLFGATVVALVCCLLAGAALADDAGVLSEGELNTWITQLLAQSTTEQPMNAPVGEESKTEDGYAFLYSFATLYYDKPVLDETSVLTGVAVTDESCVALRGITLGSPADALLATYGWQNPYLMGDGSFASFYRLDELPRAAYWCWAQHDGLALNSVQCAIHVNTGGDLYTDAGVLYTLENDGITGIRVYGLNQTVSLADVQSNLRAVMSVEAAGSGDEMEAHQPETVFEAGLTVQASSAEPFTAADLKFGGIDYLALTMAGAEKAFGAALNEQRIADDNGETMVTTEREGLTLSYTESADGAISTLETLSMTADVLEGPRGIRIGAELSDVQAAFAANVEGEQAAGNMALLYGDGITPPFGQMERVAENVVELRYAAQAERAGETVTVTLHMTFTDDRLTELMIYSW